MVVDLDRLTKSWILRSGEGVAATEQAQAVPCRTA